ncbi:MAG TPA: rhodanese-like domain-containing protein [Chitinophagaceae bacterium]
MKNLCRLTLFALLLVFTSCGADAQKPENWTADQLMQPADLAAALNARKDIPVIICVGPGAIIPNSVNIGPVNKPDGLEKLKAALDSIPKDRKVVVYCGCCPFDHCPNVRPAIDALKALSFKHYYLLNLPHNVKTDWIDKGYPTAP